MPTNMRNILQAIWRRIYPSTIATVPTKSAVEQTKSSWAKPIKSYDAVPVVYKGFFNPFKTDGRPFPYTVLTPTYEGFIHRATEKLICDLGREIYVLEKRGNTFEAQCYPLQGIIYVEFRTILLDSYIKINGVRGDGVLTSSTLKFNSVTEYLFTPFVERIRLATVYSKDEVPSSELEKFDKWVRLNYKFMNFAKRSLLGGEKVIHTILQPEILASVVTVLGKTYYRTVFPTHVIMLTDRELIIIREEARRSGNERYGGIWDYIPLNKIVTLSLGERDSNLLVLSIKMVESDRLECLLQASKKGEIDQLLDRFRELTLR